MWGTELSKSHRQARTSRHSTKIVGKFFSVLRGVFSGNVVVSMRPIKKVLVNDVIEITSKFPDVHGSPIYVGNPDEIGIKNILKPDYGDYVDIDDDEVPVFWACGVSAQNAIRSAKLEIAITHSPGHMLLTDIKNQSLKIK